jgi:hypothetical protein
MVVFLGFAAVLGTFLSLKGKKTSRAQSTTIAILVALNGGLLCFGSCLMHSILPAFTCTPMIQALSLLSSENVGEMLNGSYVGRPDGEAVLTCILGVLAYAVAAVCLASAAVSGFDEAVDRPRRKLFGIRPIASSEKDSDIKWVEEELP